MNISRSDAVAYLAKWFDARSQVRATFKTISGNSCIVGNIKELNPAGIKIVGKGCEMMLHFRNTSEYDYKDVKQPDTELNKERTNKYPTVIDIKFSNGDHLEVLEFFEE